MAAWAGRMLWPGVPARSPRTPPMLGPPVTRQGHRPAGLPGPLWTRRSCQGTSGGPADSLPVPEAGLAVPQAGAAGSGGPRPPAQAPQAGGKASVWDCLMSLLLTHNYKRIRIDKNIFFP